MSAAGVYWAFSWLAILRGLSKVLSPKVILWFGGGGGMASRFLMVCQSRLLPGGQSWRWVSHLSFLWEEIILLISLLISSIWGLSGFSLLSLSLSSINLFASEGMAGRIFGILPEGICCVYSYFMSHECIIKSDQFHFAVKMFYCYCCHSIYLSQFCALLLLFQN